MNDETAGQLTAAWDIPAYAQDMLWLDTESGSAQCTGAKGLFELEAPASVLTVRWGVADGPPLTQLNWQADTLGWDGTVRLAGMVESLHMAEIPGLEETMLVIASFSAHPLLPETIPYPNAQQRNAPAPNFPAYEEGVDDTSEPMIVTLLTLHESPLAQIAQDALLQNIPLHVYGNLADEAGGWHQFVALPIIWEAVTLFTP